MRIPAAPLSVKAVEVLERPSVSRVAAMALNAALSPKRDSFRQKKASRCGWASRHFGQSELGLASKVLMCWRQTNVGTNC